MRDPASVRRDLAAQDPAYGLIPLRIVEGLVRFNDDGIPTGDFLRAVLCNDLMGAMGRADDECALLIRPICLFVVNQLDRRSWGDEKTVDAWVKLHSDLRDDSRR